MLMFDKQGIGVLVVDISEQPTTKENTEVPDAEVPVKNEDTMQHSRNLCECVLKESPEWKLEVIKKIAGSFKLEELNKFGHETTRNMLHFSREVIK